MKLTRRKFVAAGLGLTSLGGLGFSYMRHGEPEWFEVTHKRAIVRGLGQPIRILHLSDFHASDVVSYDFIEAAVKTGLEQQPDLIFLTGDFITWKLENADRYCSILTRLSDAAPTYACIGNHDGGKWAGSSHGYPTFELVAQLLRNSNVALLVNERQTAIIRGQSIDVVGLGDIWSQDAKPELALTATRAEQRPVLVLSHNPDSKVLLQDYDWDVMFCGHTHGGQLIVPLLNYRPFLPIRDKCYAEGLLLYSGRQIHVTRGVGNLHGMRFNCRPEVSLLDVASA